MLSPNWVQVEVYMSSLWNLWTLEIMSRTRVHVVPMSWCLYRVCRVYVKFMSISCRVHVETVETVKSMSRLCWVYVMPMSCLCHVYVVSISSPCRVHAETVETVESMSSLCRDYVLSSLCRVHVESLNVSEVLLEGKECSSTSRLGRTSDSAMLMTQSWFDVTVFTTYS